MSSLPHSAVRLIELALEEDVGGGDITSEATIAPSQMGRAEVVAKAPLVVAGLAAGVEVYRQTDPEVLVHILKPAGTACQPGDVIAVIEGRLRSILTGERVFLNFVGQLSGVATLTSRCVAEVAGTPCKILDTRKTVPGMRLLQKAAVVAGGGHNHRMGLYDAVLIKDNHEAAAGGVAAAIARVRAHAGPEIEIEVEAGTLAEVREAVEAGADIILLDNMSTGDMAEAVKLVAGRAATEASGNMTPQRLRETAAAGVDRISIGALTHSAPCADISMRVTAADPA